MKIKVLYEDSNILAIDKPSGISVHSDGKTKEKTIADFFIKKGKPFRNRFIQNIRYDIRNCNTATNMVNSKSWQLSLTNEKYKNPIKNTETVQIT